jgi:hypothetical protein
MILPKKIIRVPWAKDDSVERMLSWVARNFINNDSIVVHGIWSTHRNIILFSEFIKVLYFFIKDLQKERTEAV